MSEKKGKIKAEMIRLMKGLSEWKTERRNHFGDGVQSSKFETDRFINKKVDGCSILTLDIILKNKNM